MPATYTDLLRITKQGDGDNNNTWGQVTNTQIIELFEDAIHNTSSIDVTASAPSFSLSTANGASDQARSAGLRFTGAPTGVVACTIPALNHIYVVRNESTEAVTLTTGGANTATIQAGKMDVIQVIGGDVRSFAQTLPGVGSPVGVAQGGTGQTSASAAFNALAPSQTGNAGKFLSTNGTVVSWESVPSPFVPGEIREFAFSSVPAGWLACGGQAVSRVTYAALFAAIGTFYGAGDGSTTFNVPDYRGRARLGLDNLGGTAANRITAAGSGIVGTTLGANGGAETHTLTIPQMPAHNHRVTYSQGASGTLDITIDSPVRSYFNNPQVVFLGLSTENTGGGLAHNNTQPSIMVNVCIKT